eukprot:scaffold16521_cov66-Cyclotella_meneghiniana.AAC.10
MGTDDLSSKVIHPTASVSLSTTDSFTIDPELYKQCFITDEEEAYYRKEIGLKPKRIESLSLSTTKSLADSISIDPEVYERYCMTAEKRAYYRKKMGLREKGIESKAQCNDATTKSTVKEMDSLVKDLEDVIKRLGATKNLAEAHSRVLKENAMLKKKIATLEKAQTSGPALRDQTNQLTEAERRMKVKKNADEHVIRNSSKAKASARRRA